MSTFSNGRRVPNVSQYIANLNTIPTSQDIPTPNAFDLGGDGLDFLNTEFFDFDASTFEHQHQNHDSASRHQTAVIGQQAVSASTEGFPYPDYQTFSQASFSQSPQNVSQSPYQTGQYTDSATGEKRKASGQMQPVGDLEEESRLAAEEDKRRRNTAASARFRVKKKQREQALEQQTKEMSNKLKALENKVSQLEMENKWLKGLITQKGDLTKAQSSDPAQSKAEQEKNVDSSPEERNDGVGTELIKAET